MFSDVTGCGNGKYLHINESIFKMGCDVCRPLVDSAWSRGHEVQLCDGLCLPYRDGCFDALLSIAGIPHQIHIPLWFFGAGPETNDDCVKSSDWDWEWDCGSDCRWI